MKVRVIKPFRDKSTGSILRKGLIIEVTEKRFGELAGPRGVFVEAIDEKTEETQQQEKPEEAKQPDNQKPKNK